MTSYFVAAMLIAVVAALLPPASCWQPSAAPARALLLGARWIVKASFAVAATAGLLLALIQMGVIVTRNVFEISFIRLEELPIYLFGIMFLLAGGAILLMDGHVRVDVLYAKWPRRWQRRVDLAGLYLFTLPFGLLVMVAAGHFVARAVHDGALNPGGIPAVFLLKSLIPVFGLTIVLAAAVRIAELMAPPPPADADHPYEHEAGL